MVVPAPAEALLAKIIGHAAILEPANQRREFHDIGRVHIADFHGESVAAEMAQTQLIPVPGCPLDRHLWQMQVHDG